MNYLLIYRKRVVKQAGAAMILGLALFTGRVGAQNQFADVIRKTDPKTPAEELKAFHLPPGFEIELVASEPAIGKPINMAFDEKGRLWITQSREYPFPAPADKPARDKIQVLSDFDKKGRARKITAFAEGLNIPIGIYPYGDGAIGYSIPYMYYFEDTNHDGHADRKEILVGRYGFEKDTHGMTSSFRRGFDGWLYANHGFHNDSTLTARDGSSITMNSGNTYRVKVDGSHIEQFAWGRVNPFGLIFDPLGDIYSADCETFPIYEILRGAYYPSFGKPNDGLGFAPAMMDHKHGSTAIAGIVYYAAANFPPAFRSNVFVGNVMTCRIDRDSLIFHGSSPWAKEEPDFLSCDDPWFRPVDLQVGPDGAMYVADFYNRIIGHYEVPLDNPGRDRERGRIWRIVYTGEKGHTKSVPPINGLNLTKDSAGKLIKEMGSENFTVRMLAMNQLVDRIGLPAVKPVTKMMRDRKSNVSQKIHGMWVLYRLKALDPKILADAAQDKDRALRIHAMRVFAEMPEWTTEQRALVLAAAADPDALVVRCAADALGRHPQLENVRALLDARQRAVAEDTHLIHVLRIALRDQLLHQDIFEKLPLAQWSEMDEATVASVCPGAPTTESARFLLKHLQKHEENHETAREYLGFAARLLPESEIPGLVEFIRAHFADDLDFQRTLFKSVQEATAQRGGTLDEAARAWGADIAVRLAASTQDAKSSWASFPLKDGKDTRNPWALQERDAADGKKATYFSTLPGGESQTGVLRSKPFAMPTKLSFFMAGHDGPPDKGRQKKNAVRLRSADTHEMIVEKFAPRNDVAQEVTWDLKKHEGEQGYLEIVDADAGGSYAWIAVGRFNPDVAPMPAIEPRAMEERKEAVGELARTFKLTALEPQLKEWLADKDLEVSVREAASQALLAISPETNFEAVGAICSDAGESDGMRNKMAEELAGLNTPAARDVLVKALIAAPERFQIKLALTLAGSAEGGEKLLETVETGKAPRRLLLQPKITERLAVAKPADYAARIAKQTKGLAPLNDEIQKVIDERKAQFNPARAKADLGAKVFAQNCSVCHSIDDHGGAVGPHLDGIGLRGLERLLEDVLDPSRNVDPYFRYSTVTLKDGTVFSGLQRREEGATIVFVDATGKEAPVVKADIESKVESQLSLMPDNFKDVIPREDFNNLMAFLLSKGQTAAK